jgi:hypothetical protein
LVESGIHVAAEVALALEKAIALLAVMVIAAVRVVLLSRGLAGKVAVAGIAFPVGIGTLFVLLQGPVVWEVSFAAMAIRHGRMVVVRSERA